MDTRQATKAIKTILLADPEALSASGLLNILVRFISQIQPKGLATPSSTPSASRCSSPESIQSRNESVSDELLSGSINEVPPQCARQSPGIGDEHGPKDGLDFSHFPKGFCGELLLRLPSACDELGDLWCVDDSDETNFNRLAGREDCRIDHLRLGEAGGKKQQDPSPASKFFAYLAARHLSSSYLSQNAKDVRAYAKSLENVEDTRRAERGIRDGLKYISLEHKTGCAGISALTSQVWQFKNLPEEDLDTAVRFLNAPEFGKVVECARTWSSRVEHLQRLYSGAVESCRWIPGGVRPVVPRNDGGRVASRIALPPLVPRLPATQQPTNLMSDFTVAEQEMLRQSERRRSSACCSDQSEHGMMVFCL